MKMGTLARKVAGVFVALDEKAVEPVDAAAKSKVTDRSSATTIGTPQTPPATDMRSQHQVGSGGNRETSSTATGRLESQQTGEIVDLNTIFQRGGVLSVPFTAEQFVDMLTSLPVSLPEEVRKQTVVASLNAVGKATGTTPDTIMADATSKLKVLNAYVDDLTHETENLVANANPSSAVAVVLDPHLSL